MKVYVINLDRNTDRMAFMSRQLAAQGVEFERFSAIDGRALDKSEFRRSCSLLRSRLAMGTVLQPGELGCALSHRSVYRKLVESGDSWACVLEDDASLTPEFAAVIADIERTFDPARKQVIMLSCGMLRPDPAEKREYRRLEAAASTLAYVISSAAASAMLKINFPVSVVADDWRRFRRRVGLELFRRFPTVAWQDEFKLGTDIPGRYRPAWSGTWRWKLWRVFGCAADWLWWKVTGR